MTIPLKVRSELQSSLSQPTLDFLNEVFLKVEKDCEDIKNLKEKVRVLTEDHKGFKETSAVENPFVSSKI